MNHCTSIWQSFLGQFVPAAPCSSFQKPDKHSEWRYNIVLAFCRIFRVHSSNLLRFHCSRKLRVNQGRHKSLRQALVGNSKSTHLACLLQLWLSQRAKGHSEARKIRVTPFSRTIWGHSSRFQLKGEWNAGIRAIFFKNQFSLSQTKKKYSKLV